MKNHTSIGSKQFKQQSRKKQFEKRRELLVAKEGKPKQVRSECQPTEKEEATKKAWWNNVLSSLCCQGVDCSGTLLLRSYYDLSVMMPDSVIRSHVSPRYSHSTIKYFVLRSFGIHLWSTWVFDTVSTLKDVQERFANWDLGFQRGTIPRLCLLSDVFYLQITILNHYL